MKILCAKIHIHATSMWALTWSHVPISKVYILQLDCSMFISQLSWPLSIIRRFNMGPISHQQTPMYRDMPYGYRVRAFSVRFRSDLDWRLIGFIAHLCVGEWKYVPQFVLQVKKRALALLIAYSTKVQRWFYFPLLSQLAVIIFAIWLCRGRNQLSLSDVEFAIIQTRSPVSICSLSSPVYSSNGPVLRRMLRPTPTMANPSSAVRSVWETLIGRSYGTDFWVYYTCHAVSVSTSSTNLTK